MASDKLPTRNYLTFLTTLAENANQIAQEDEIGEVEYKVEQLQPNLTCVAVRFIDPNDGPYERHELFAAGFYRNYKLARIRRCEDGSELIISDDPEALLAILSY